MRISLILGVALILCQQARAGVDYGNGGDLLYCTETGSAEGFTYRSLDYEVAAATAADAGLELVPVNHASESMGRIINLLRKKQPALADSFADFLKYHRNFSDVSQPRVWRHLVGFRPMPIHDEELDPALIPAACKSPNGEPRLRQVVVRHTLPAKIVYDFNFMILGDLARNVDPVSQTQVSYLYVHEWLWDIVTTAKTGRMINRFLHSTALADLSAEEVAAELAELGIPDQLPDPYVPSPSRLLIGKYHLISGAEPWYVVPVYRGEILARLTMHRIEYDEVHHLDSCYRAGAENSLAFIRDGNGVLRRGSTSLKNMAKTSFVFVDSTGRDQLHVLFPTYPAPLLDPCP